MFCINGVVNRQSRSFGGAERPDKHNPVVKNSPSIMTSCAISKERVLGPYCFENENVTSESPWNMQIH